MSASLFQWVFCVFSTRGTDMLVFKWPNQLFVLTTLVCQTKPFIFQKEGLLNVVGQPKATTTAKTTCAFKHVVGQPIAPTTATTTYALKYVVGQPSNKNLRVQICCWPTYSSNNNNNSATRLQTDATAGLGLQSSATSNNKVNIQKLEKLNQQSCRLNDFVTIKRINNVGDYPMRDDMEFFEPLT